MRWFPKALQLRISQNNLRRATFHAKLHAEAMFWKSDPPLFRLSRQQYAVLFRNIVVDQLIVNRSVASCLNPG